MYRTGDEYFDGREFREKLESYEEATETGQPMFMDADDLADIADYYNIVGETDKADDIIEQALELHPGATLPLVFKARKAIADGDPRQAMSYALEIINRDDPEYTYVLAEIYIAMGKPYESDKILQEHYEEAEEDELEDIVIDAANIFMDTDQYDYAEEWMNKAQDTDHDDYRELMARLLFARGKYQESMDIFNELIDRNPYSKKSWQGLAASQFMMEDFHGAVTSSEYAIAIDPNDPNSLVAKANAMFRLENYEEAYEYYHRYSERNPKDEYGEMSQGISLAAIGQHERAIPHLEKAARLAKAQPYSMYRPQIQHELAFTYADIKQFDKAHEALDRTETMACDLNETDLIRGHVYLCEGKVEEAESFFKAAVRHSEDKAHAMLRVVVSLHDNGYLQSAYEVFRQMHNIYGDDLKDGFSYMALCCNDLRLTEEFLHYTKLATEHNPQEARMVLGKLFPKDLDPTQYYEYAKGIWG